ncbi:hypothetical protein Tco_0051183 [Tanacetum coccineum]
MSSYNHFGCSWCGGPFNGGNCRRCTNVRFRDKFVRNPDPISYDETPDFSYPPPQPQYETYACELCGNDSHYGFDCPPRFPLVYEHEPCYNQNFGDNYYPQNSPSFPPQYLCCEKCGVLGINLHKLVLLVQELNTAQDINNSTNWVSTARRKVSTASTELNTARED